MALGYILGLGLDLGLAFPPPTYSFFPYIAAAAIPIMSAPSPPPSPPPPPATSPPTSRQLHQQAMRHQERLQRDTVSPELRRIPSTSSTTLSNALVTPLVLSWCHAFTYAYLYFAPTLFVRPGRS